MSAAESPAASELGALLIKTMPQTMGACLVGTFICTASVLHFECLYILLINGYSNSFYGITILQTYQYFSKSWGRDKILLPVLLSVMSTGVVACIVQVFYAYRVWMREPPLGIFMTPSLTQPNISFTIAYMVLLFRDGTLLDIPAVTYLATTAFGCALLADLIIAISATIYLMLNRQQGFKKTNGMISKLVIYTINTGAITIVFTFITLLLGQIKLHTMYNTIFYFPLSKCYVSSMLAFLNARDSLRSTSNTVSVELGPTPRGTQPRRRSDTTAPVSKDDLPYDGGMGIIKFGRPDESVNV
ncbi:hypothetical protein C8J56DRAFT_900220 [Mycena floridula]|nr:hypothetical protein C8J56DRAFT_900220 [Mycena floridula]